MVIPPGLAGTMASLANLEFLTWQTIWRQLVQPILGDAALTAAYGPFLDFV